MQIIASELKYEDSKTTFVTVNRCSKFLLAPVASIQKQRLLLLIVGNSSEWLTCPNSKTTFVTVNLQ